MYYICQIFGLLLITVQVYANNYDSLIDSAIQFAEYELEQEFSGRVVVSIKKQNGNINIQGCDKDINFSIVNASRSNQKVVVLAKCSTPTWVYHLPAAVKIFRNVVTAIRPLNRQTIIEEDDLLLQERDINLITGGFFDNIKDVRGKEVKYSLRTGAVVAPKNITNPKIVKRGDIVQITAQESGLAVSMQGIAQDSGALGDNIKIKNTSSNRVIDAVVAGPSKTVVRLTG